MEAWFYLSDVKAQMLTNDSVSPLTGSNSFGIYFNWRGYTKFSPLIGTLLPCGLQQGKQYTFKGLISATLNPKLIFRIGVCMGQRFYVPNRPFSKNMVPDSITSLVHIPKTPFYAFEYRFTATGEEKYLTFGTYIETDTVVDGKKKIETPQTVSVILDNFQLIPADSKETACGAFAANKETIYKYDFRHKEMDYSLYGRGELKIVLEDADSSFTTRITEPEILKPVKTDTLKLGDVLFDFNKAVLKPAATKVLTTYFTANPAMEMIDSIYIEGHTDSVGTDKRNLQLSADRCSSVQQWLIENNIITAGNSFIHPFGRSRPVATNKTPEGRALNRRVEIIIFRRRA